VRNLDIDDNAEELTQNQKDEMDMIGNTKDTKKIKDLIEKIKKLNLTPTGVVRGV